MMGYDDFIELSGLISEHQREIDDIRKAISNFLEICEIARRECDEKTEWAMSGIQELNARIDKINKDYIKECEAVYKKHTNGCSSDQG